MLSVYWRKIRSMKSNLQAAFTRVLDVEELKRLLLLTLETKLEFRLHSTFSVAGSLLGIFFNLYIAHLSVLLIGRLRKRHHVSAEIIRELEELSRSYEPFVLCILDYYFRTRFVEEFYQHFENGVSHVQAGDEKLSLNHLEVIEMLEEDFTERKNTSQYLSYHSTMFDIWSNSRCRRYGKFRTIELWVRGLVIPTTFVFESSLNVEAMTSRFIIKAYYSTNCVRCDDYDSILRLRLTTFAIYLFHDCSFSRSRSSAACQYSLIEWFLRFILVIYVLTKHFEVDLFIYLVSSWRIWTHRWLWFKEKFKTSFLSLEFGRADGGSVTLYKTSSISANLGESSLLYIIRRKCTFLYI